MAKQYIVQRGQIEQGNEVLARKGEIYKPKNQADADRLIEAGIIAEAASKAPRSKPASGDGNPPGNPPEGGEGEGGNAPPGAEGNGGDAPPAGDGTGGDQDPDK